MLTPFSRLHDATNVLSQSTVESFVTLYTQTIAEQAQRLEQFTRMAAHEWRQQLGALQVGVNQWYRIPQFAAFLLEHAYINGNDKAHCDTGNGATSCLIGKFVNFITTGTVGPGIGGGTTDGAIIGTQLIK